LFAHNLILIFLFGTIHLVGESSKKFEFDVKETDKKEDEISIESIEQSKSCNQVSTPIVEPTLEVDPPTEEVTACDNKDSRQQPRRATRIRKAPEKFVDINLE
jgi:hypothetical protein